MTYAIVWAVLLLLATGAFATNLARLLRAHRGDSARRGLLLATLAPASGGAFFGLNLALVVRDGSGSVAVPAGVAILLLVALLLSTWSYYRTLRPRA